jgi:uncharacterized peroxidase-related enzyme
VQHHGAGLRRLGREQDFIQGLVTNWRATAADDDRLSALLAYAERLTRHPASITARDVERMRDAGLEDAAILHACEVTSYFNFVNRVADGLGVQLEDDWDHPLLCMPGEGPTDADD